MGYLVFIDAIKSKEWKKVKASDKTQKGTRCKMKKYKDLYEEEKQRHDPKEYEVQEALKRYQKDHMDEMEIINLHKRCNKKTMNVSQPKKISKSDEPKKVSKPIDDSSKEEQRPKKADGKNVSTKAGKNSKGPVNKTTQPKKPPKSSELVDTDSDTEDEQEPVVKKRQKASKTLGLIDTGPNNKDPQETSPGSVHKEPAKPEKRLPAGIRKGKQCRLRASDKTGKFCNYHKRQT